MDKLLKIKEVAEIFGLHPDTIRHWVLNNKIESVKIGGSRRIKQSEVDRLKEGK